FASTAIWMATHAICSLATSIGGATPANRHAPPRVYCRTPSEPPALRRRGAPCAPLPTAPSAPSAAPGPHALSVFPPSPAPGAHPERTSNPEGFAHHAAPQPTPRAFQGRRRKNRKFAHHGFRQRTDGLE